MAKKGSLFIEIDGGVTLRRALRKAGADLKELSTANRKAAATVATRAKALAPVGDDKGGHISATIRAGGTTTAGVVRVGNRSKPYAGVVHYGWRARGITNVKPWVINAARETEPIWLQTYYSELKEIIEKIG